VGVTCTGTLDSGFYSIPNFSMDQPADFLGCWFYKQRACKVYTYIAVHSRMDGFDLKSFGLGILQMLALVVIIVYRYKSL